MQIYISNNHQAQHFGKINTQTDGEVQQLGILRYVEGWWQIADEEALTLLTGSKSKSKKAKRYEEAYAEGQTKIQKVKKQRAGGEEGEFTQLNFGHPQHVGIEVVEQPPQLSSGRSKKRKEKVGEAVQKQDGRSDAVAEGPTPITEQTRNATKLQ